MKKLKLSLQNIEGAEVLTREQLKKVIGGEGGSEDVINVHCTYVCCDGSDLQITGPVTSCQQAWDNGNTYCSEHEGTHSITCNCEL